MYQDGDENLPYLIQVIINGPDRRTEGLTTAYNSTTSDKARQLIADTAEKLRTYDNVDFDMWNITEVMLINAEDGAESMGHNALVLVDRYGNGAFFRFYLENNGFGALIGLEDGELRFRTISGSVTNHFINSGTVSYLTASDSDTERETYNR